MSRWSRKTLEEKEQTKANLENNTKINKPKFEKQMDETNDKKLEIMKNGEIPLRCKKCGVTSSEKYKLAMYNTPLGEQQGATGRCKKCGSWCIQYLSPGVMGIETSMLIAQIMVILQTQGRLKDERNSKVREWK